MLLDLCVVSRPRCTGSAFPISVTVCILWRLDIGSVFDMSGGALGAIVLAELAISLVPCLCTMICFLTVSSHVQGFLFSRVLPVCAICDFKRSVKVV